MFKRRLLIVKGFLRSFHKEGNAARAFTITTVFSVFVFLAGSQYFSNLKNAQDFISAKNSIDTFLIFSLLILISTCIISVINVFIFSNDLDLYLRSPQTQLAFFLDRTLLVWFFNSALFFIFSAPYLLSTSYVYEQDSLSYLYALLFPCLLSLLACFLASFLIFCTLKFFSLFKKKFFLLLLPLILLPLIPNLDSPTPYSEFKDIIKKKVIFPNYLPSSLWSSHIFHLESDAILISHTICLLALGFICSFISFRLFYFDILSVIHEFKIPLFLKRNLHSSFSRKILASDKRLRAFLFKESRTMLRDLSQAVQLIFLLALTFFYIQSFKSLKEVSSIKQEVESLWIIVLAASNILMGGFVVCAIASRLVYPSISLEGRAFDLILTSPISKKDFLKKKFNIWFWPIFLIATTVLLSGALSLALPPLALFATLLIAFSLSQSIVSQGLNTGAQFKNLTWTSPSEVYGQLGGFYYMMRVTFILLFNLLPCALALAITAEPEITNVNLSTALILLLSILLINYLFSRIVLSRALQFI